MDSLPEGMSISVEAAPPSATAPFVGALATLVNSAYAAAEADMWLPGTPRTTVREIADLVSAGQVLVARRAGVTIGCVRVNSIDEDTGEFGMLATDPHHRGRGIGRELVAAAESRCAAAGRRVMRLELLVPRDRDQPDKVFLRNWYTRIGYAQVGLASIEDDHPDLAPRLVVPCDYLVYEKRLVPSHL